MADRTLIQDEISAEIQNEHETTSAKESIKDRAGRVGRAAANEMDRQREPAARALDRAASALDERAGSLPGGERVSHFAHSTAGTLSSTAHYLRDHDLQAMGADIGQIVRRNPGRSLAIAAVLGFLAGRRLRSR